MKRKPLSIRTILLAGLVVAVLSVMIHVLSKRPKPHEAPLASTKPSQMVEKQNAEPPSSIGSLASQEPMSKRADPPPPAEPGAKPEAKARTTAPATKSGGSGEKAFQDPLAREALSLIGLDADAELYWFAALTDPSLPQSERQDLVDDLNEEGLPDPKHPNIDDLPLLLARIEILEEAALWFDGEVYDWKEPYEDLTNLVALALGGGKPVH